MDKVKLHKEICDKLNNTYRDKNSDYGDSFARVRKEEGEASILVRLKDKVYRLETLLHGTASKVTSESIEDSFIDLANYCIMELVERSVDASDKKVQKVVDELMKPCNDTEAVDHAEHYWENRG